MGEDPPTYDSVLERSFPLPDSFKITDFLRQRMEEVVMLTEAINESPFRGQAFQRLPKHMRRRQMSHHIQRWPRRLRGPHLLSLKDGLPEPKKRPSRRYRRRPANLLVEYNRRQRTHIWLETHIWHAKRFHMIEKWGYKLPQCQTSKSFRAGYRAISEHCLITDISYNNCIELNGSEEVLLSGLKQCTSQNCGLTFAARMFLNGAKEGSTTVFHPNSYPYRAIGNVRFMWKRPDDQDRGRRIWIWVHPLFSDEFIECLKNLFSLSLVENTPKETDGHETNVEDVTPEMKCKKQKKKQKTEQMKLEPRNVPFNRTPKYKNADESVTMAVLKDTLNRFQLTGPLSQAIVSQAFTLIPVQRKNSSETARGSEKRRLSEPEETSNPVKKVKTDGNPFVEDDVMILSESPNKTQTGDDVGKSKWWTKYYAAEEMEVNWQHQKEFYEEKMAKCSKPSCVLPGLILPLVIADPRMTIPSKGEKAIPRSKETCQIAENSYEVGLHQSPIWDSDVRDEVSLTKLTTGEINEARSKKIVPGSCVDDVIPDGKQSRIPILLVQRPGVTDSRHGRIGLGCGWDVISPAGFAMPIWRALVLRGARPGGLRETELVKLEANNLRESPQPDSFAWKVESERKARQLRSRHFSLTPKTRPNYVKLGVPSPFTCPWDLLVADWTKRTGAVPDGTFRVLRDVQSLQDLHRAAANVGLEDAERLMERTGTNCLVRVTVTCPGGGRPEELAMICLPREDDLTTPPVEPVHPDENENLRKDLKRKHAKLLKSLSKKRKKARAKLREEFANALPGQLTPADVSQVNVASSKKMSDEYNAKMEDLWVPDPYKMDSIVDVPSRLIVGFAVEGSFAHSKAFCTAMGYVTMPGLVELFKVNQRNKKELRVLLRNRHETQYAVGRLQVVED